MWNPNNFKEEDDSSWEVKAFEEDTRNLMGTTWPPRSYTCTFCRREFRSAQALGGHMNVHRRDRARLHQTHPKFKNPNVSSSSTLLIPAAQEFVAINGDLCLVYSLPKPDVKALFPHSFKSSLSNSSNTEALMSTTCKSDDISIDKKRKKADSEVEGVDLELRLGCSPC